MNKNKMTPKIFEALEFAVRAHAGQLRKASKTPYIFHPVRVAEILSEHGSAENMVIAALLHDTLEDTDVTEKEIESKFGSQVLEWVKGASEPGHKSKPWMERKRHTIDYVKTAPYETALLICADKLDNLRSIKDDYKVLGESLWQRFHESREKQHWYYTELAASFKARLRQNEQSEMFQTYIREAVDFPGC